MSDRYSLFTYKMQECPERHYSRSSKVSIHIEELTDRGKLGYLLIATLIRFRHVFRLILLLLLHHGPHYVLVLKCLSLFNCDHIVSNDYGLGLWSSLSLLSCLLCLLLICFDHFVCQINQKIALLLCKKL